MLTSEIDAYLNADGIGHLTTEIWWSMIEMGISVIAACLSTIRPLFGDFQPDRIIHSIRSMFSLQSLDSLRPSVRGQAAMFTGGLSENNSKCRQFSDDQISIRHSQRKPSVESGAAQSIRLRDLAQNYVDSMPASAPHSR